MKKFYSEPVFKLNTAINVMAASEIDFDPFDVDIEFKW